MSLLRCATQAEELATSPHSAKKIKRRPCSHLHPPPSTNTHQSHKCLGKAFLNYRGVCHSARKWNASQLQTTLERISELISCDKTSVHFDMHAGSSEIWIQPPELKSLISQGYLHGLCFEFCWGLPLRSTPVAQTGKPNCSPDLPHQGGKDSWTPHGSSAVFLETSQLSLGADFKNHFSNSILRCHSPY